MKKLIKISLLLLWHIQLVCAQDLQITQFYATPMLLNPAFAGISACSKVSLLYRNQWPGISNVYRTKIVTFDHAIKKSNFGIGCTLGVDDAGSGNLRTTVINPVIAYQARINKNASLRFGLQPGLGIKSVNFNKLTFGDQIYRGGNVTTVEAAPQNKTYFDLSVGTIYTFSDYWAGISIQHLNLPNESFYKSLYNTLPVKYSFQIGTKICLNKNEVDKREKKYLSPVLHYKAQNKFDQFDIGFYFTKHIFTLGVWYRGLQGIKAYKKGYANNDAIALLIGIQTERLKIGYSYDKTISKLATVSKGAHEITLSFQFCNPKKRKTKLVLIACPKF